MSYKITVSFMMNSGENIEKTFRGIDRSDALDKVDNYEEQNNYKIQWLTFTGFVSETDRDFR